MSVPLAVLLDLTLGEPPAKVHPVVLMGNYLQFARRRWQARGARGQLLQGAAWWALGAAGSYAFGRGAQGAVKALPRPLRDLALAALLKPTFSARGLFRAVGEVERPLRAGDLAQARQMLSWHLVSRDTGDLMEEEVAGAALESLFENLSDSVVGPLLAFQLGGLGLAYLYRFANTADAMWGYRTPELEWNGKVAARADDALNLLPARVSALLILLGTRVTGEDAARATRVWRADAHLTSSPNAGHPMSVAAGALGVRLDKRGHYILNAAGRAPQAGDLAGGLRLAAAALALGAVLLIGGGRA
ncbi:adenosylcobinamide-phosphate synthase CbiB [Deinococcus peraridilitoris]|uniref:Cobalamin biosynthesis protein CobD n=1 Tax=Deinococcus peraridilitoris (strain DSM 19664 / LMG 22246 / CIP 109416 / KR-200) TaxID=937777 RepID=L0A3N5_DEIPD|nr:adenosylcobinamide-phosphate synthase CbiB [Deinococcus peraridilitoris]AFZ67797.1 cobalamin biosynthesis protein CobD [Deinococcus peraridilitoris DSM 19664]